KLAAELRSRITITEIPPEVAPQAAARDGSNGHAESAAPSDSHASDSNHSKDEVFERAAQALLSAEAPIGSAWSAAEERSEPALVPSSIRNVGSSAPPQSHTDPPARKSFPPKPPPPSSAPLARRSSVPPPSPIAKPVLSSANPAVRASPPVSP